MTLPSDLVVPHQCCHIFAVGVAVQLFGVALEITVNNVLYTKTVLDFVAECGVCVAESDFVLFCVCTGV